MYVKYIRMWYVWYTYITLSLSSHPLVGIGLFPYQVFPSVYEKAERFIECRRIFLSSLQLQLPPPSLVHLITLRCHHWRELEMWGKGEAICRVSSLTTLCALPSHSGSLLPGPVHSPLWGTSFLRLGWWQLLSRQVSSVLQEPREGDMWQCLQKSEKVLCTRWCSSSCFKDKGSLLSEENMLMMDRWEDSEGHQK